MANDRCELAVYNLLNPQVLVKNQDSIKALLCLNQNPDDFRIFINPVSGWIKLKNTKIKQQEIAKPFLAKSSEEALKSVEQYFAAVNKIMLRKGGRFQLLGIPPLFTMKLGHVFTNPILNRRFGMTDHWLLRFRILLDTAFENKMDYVPVMGAGLDIRLGSKNQLISLSYRWRPFVQKKRKLIKQEFVQQMMAGLPALQAVEAAHHPNENNQYHHREPVGDQQLANETVTETDEPLNLNKQINSLLESGLRFSYKIDGDYDPSNSLAPFMLWGSGHHLAYAPLCEQSLIARISYDPTISPFHLEANVIGGSGLYDYEWAYWQIHQLEDGIHTGDNGPSLTISPELYNVALHVRDRKTGQSTQTQIMTYSFSSDQNLNPNVT